MNSNLRLLIKELNPLHLITVPEPNDRYIYKVIASTGKYTSGLNLTLDFIECADDIKILAETIKKRLNYEIERQIITDRYLNAEPHHVLHRHIIVDSAAPVTHDITVCHPERYASLLKYGQHPDHNWVPIPNKINWKKRITGK